MLGDIVLVVCGTAAILDAVAVAVVAAAGYSFWPRLVLDGIALVAVALGYAIIVTIADMRALYRARGWRR